MVENLRFGEACERKKKTDKKIHHFLDEDLNFCHGYGKAPPSRGVSLTAVISLDALILDPLL
jgi:hypothetical protein